MVVHPGRGENPSLAESLISAEAEELEQGFLEAGKERLSGEDDDT